MKKITFNLPNKASIVQLLLITDEPKGVGIQSQFFNITGGNEEFTFDMATKAEDYKLLDVDLNDNRSNENDSIEGEAE